MESLRSIRVLFLLAMGMAMSLPSSAAPFKVLEQRVSTTDGTQLRTFVYLPEGAGPFPTLVYRTPYGAPFGTLGGYPEQENRGTVEDPTRVGWPLITDAGYALVVQYIRGRFGSEGTNQLFWTEREDGADLVHWILDQDWSDGRLGSLGDSAYGITSLLLASAQPTRLTAAYAQVASGDLFNSSVLGPGGALKLESFLVWVNEQASSAGLAQYRSLGLQVGEIESVREEMLRYGNLIESGIEQPHESEVWLRLPLIDHPATSPVISAWTRLLEEGYESDWARKLQTADSIEVPTLQVSMWHDVFNTSAIETFLQVDQRTGTQRLMVMNGTHYSIDGPDAWPVRPMLPWFDYWLKGEEGALDGFPKISFALSGAEDVWYAAETWPPAGVSNRHFTLHGDGSLDESAPAENEPARDYVYDPQNPVPTIGGRNLIIEAGPRDQRPVEPPHRDDVLLYRSTPLEEDLTIMGPVSVDLSVASDRPDTDFTAKLIDLFPDGTAMLVVDGIIRARYRGGGPEQDLLSAGEVVELTIELGHIAYRFSAGHRLQVDISSSNFPQWDRNPNTGGVLYQEHTTVPATNMIYHEAERRSTLHLPVLEEPSGVTQLDWKRLALEP
ncbi:MAG: CocE/NonD family hydrolase [Gammaproteobacteria bacterium]